MPDNYTSVHLFDLPVTNHASSSGTPANAFSASLSIQLIKPAEFGDLCEQWASLIARSAVPNVFMDPAVALAFAESWPDPIRIMLTWLRDPEAGNDVRLVGAWLLVERSTRLTWPLKALVSPVGPVAYLGTPVIDAAYAAPVLTAMLEHIRTTPALPKLVLAGDMSGGSAVMDALEKVLADGKARARLIEARSRARLSACEEAEAFWAASMSTRHRQDFARKRRQLGRMGELVFSCVDEPEAVAAGLEEFLMLEASGWKGKRKSALTCDATTAHFTRRTVAELAQRRLVSLQALRLNGVPIAMAVVLFAGEAAYTWRTAYDETYRRFSPGVLLLENTTAYLITNPAVTVTDSCNHRDTGFQAERWPERHVVLDLLIDVNPGLSVRLLLLWSRETTIRRGRELARRLYWQLQRTLSGARQHWHDRRSTKSVF